MNTAVHEPGRGFSGTPRVPPCRLASGIPASRRPLKPLPDSCLTPIPSFGGARGIPDTSVVPLEGGRRLSMGWGRFSPTVWRHGCRRRAYKEVFTACRRRPPPTHALRAPFEPPTRSNRGNTAAVITFIPPLSSLLIRTGVQHSMTFTARPPREVSLYLVFMSAPVWRMVRITLSRET